MVKRGTRTHAGSCAAYATRETLWREDRLDEHMAMMRAASKARREERLRKRLAVIAPTVPADVATALYERGYKAGHQARRRR